MIPINIFILLNFITWRKTKKDDEMWADWKSLKFFFNVGTAALPKPSELTWNFTSAKSDYNFKSLNYLFQRVKVPAVFGISAFSAARPNKLAELTMKFFCRLTLRSTVGHVFVFLCLRLSSSLSALYFWKWRAVWLEQPKVRAKLAKFFSQRTIDHFGN